MVGKVTPDNIATGSTIAAIMGHNKYQTPLEAYNNAVNGRPEWVQSLPAKIGDHMEDFVLRESAEILGLGRLELDYPEAFWHEDYLAVSLDGTGNALAIEVHEDPDKGVYIMSGEDSVILTGAVILEAKTTRVQPQTVPDMYRGPLQLQAQMLCTGSNWGAVCTLYQGSELRIFVYKANREMQKLIIEAAKDFKRRVEEEDPYPALSPAEAIEKYPPGKEKKIIYADDALCDKVRQLTHIRSELKSYEKLEEDLQTDIMEMMKDADECYAGQQKVIWPVRNIKAKPEQVKVIPAVEAEQKRGKTLKIEDLK